MLLLQFKQLCSLRIMLTPHLSQLRLDQAKFVDVNQPKLLKLCAG